MRHCAIFFWVAVAFSGQGIAAESRLTILAETGQSRDGVPVYALHPDPGAVEGTLSHGFSGRMLRLYQWEQEYLRRATGSQPEPAYLLLSNRQGGFPRFGFYLDSKDKRGAGYVDLHHTQRAAGRFGAMDQIFPHELAHIIVRQMAGEPGKGGSNQMHAIGVRTDPSQAYQEGFAEHFQLMALEDPDADPATRALINSAEDREMAEHQARNYRRDLQSRWPLPGPARMGFLIWFSGIEQSWRYFAVKANGFAYANDLPERMLAASDPYPAYLLLNALPGNPGGTVKPASVLLSTEGVVSSLFYRWACNDRLRKTYRDEEFYSHFGTSRAEVSPVENIYLKIFHVLYTEKPANAAGVIRAYKKVFPDESEQIDTVVRQTLLGQILPAAPEIWLANRNFQTGSSLFDQFRSLPRSHTFDLNAATLLDLLAVPGMTRSAADRILKNAPYAGVGDLKRVPGITQALLSGFEEMSAEMRRLEAGEQEGEAGLSLGIILRSYAWRAVAMLVLASVGAAFLYRRARRCGVLRATINGTGASLLVLALAWITTDTAAIIAFAAPLLVFGIPAVLWQAIRRRGLAQTARTFAAWALAAVPAVVMAYPWL